ncbi:MAG: 2-succinyl-5-enolpyruvyl-6-hydroxy-3-cyclohexene-1-carboxylic-acid synthase [Thiohalocapsa sp.]|jgi:2-succinyl-5-enolpyruvyl-6-hydroxy-3-cyclohexene-1-carboxylate synthase|uniref:2-succinyl-5-enolpyruvyl-6-hydroxy-3- cyclohexene-1-carboxylic-acid synthase n=1 Tax=Thiohalocapsa sp. TaxID=2497641 RepID=UPI0025E2F4FF|nr:2-succinyl-5-enolpyruvyl-6-hydroxy-3-cyclohexene-1-carboxylic-acid synthase [Thiohalocapsa sp.]MCG6943476.1 2-succinyl-5-enolpyruvyl-6-hydroxy-3-cyclohexene-1-carboxylic-acid synthase [Thiohalocapsa sp.]
MDQGCINLRWAGALLAGLAAGGVRILVLSPGSRSTPVVLAAQQRGDFTLIPILDERSAGFFALGAARASGRPVALLATSGSAPAHWYPAVIEASETGVPLVLLSADRPPALRGFGANQTIDQTRLFGAFAREAHDPGLPRAADAALKAVASLGLRCAVIASGSRPGPVQVNLPFEEPLVPAAGCDGTLPAWPPAGHGSTAPSEPTALAPISLPPGRGLVVCGPGLFPAGFAESLCATARRLALPVLADPLSGLRFGPAADSVLAHYDALLRHREAAERLRPEWVLRFGGAPVSKVLGQWLSGVPALLVDPAGGWRDPSHDVQRRLVAHPAAVCAALSADAEPDRAWNDTWHRADARVRDLADQHLAAAPWCEAHLIRALLARIPAGEALLCANSLPIRQLDTWSGTRTEALALHGNRGASGIDGQCSTLAGLNYAGPPCWGLLGDLSAVHDLSGWLLGDRFRRPVIVIDNGGGRIFDYLPQHGLPGFEQLWRTPVAPDLGELASVFGLRHCQVADASALDEVLDGNGTPAGEPGAGGPPLVEVRIDADASRAMHLAFWNEIAQTKLLD